MTILVKNYLVALSYVLIGLVIGMAIMSIMHVRWDHQQFHEVHTWYRQIREMQIRNQMQREALEKQTPTVKPEVK